MKSISEEEEVTEGSGLLGGLTAWHLRVLTESPWDGGGGYTLEEVGRMSLDQIWSRLCKMDILKQDVGGRVEKVESLAAASIIETDNRGFVKGRASDGTEIRGKIRGRSKARELIERAKKTRRRK